MTVGIFKIFLKYFLNILNNIYFYIANEKGVKDLGKLKENS